MDNPLGPILAAGFAIQQLLEILGPLVELLVGEPRKKIILGLVALFGGLILAYGLELHLLEYFKLYTDKSSIKVYLDVFVTALVISAGTEGTNSILKTAKYFKENQKATAAETLKDLIPNTRTLGTPSSAVLPESVIKGINPSALGNLEKLRHLESFDSARETEGAKALSYINKK